MIRDAFCLFLICGCSPLKSTGLDTASTIDNNLSDDPDDPDDPTPLTGTLTVSGSRVFDPKLAEGHIRVDVSVNDEDTDCAITLSAKNGIGQSWTHPDASGAIVWNGEDDDGLTFDPGSVSLTITADCDLATHTLAETQIFIARLGLTSINFDNLIGDAISDANIPLAFHKQNLHETHISPIGDRPEYLLNLAGVLGSRLDNDDGSPRPTIPTWADPDVPPWAETEAAQHNVPAAYIASQPIGATVTIGDFGVSQARHIRVDAFGPKPDDLPPIRLLLNDHVVTSLTIAAGMNIGVTLDNASATMGKEIRTLQWRFESALGDDWFEIPGQIETTHTIYTLAGPPALLNGSDLGKAPPIPWVGILEDTALIMEGVDASAGAVLDALRDYLFEHEYIIYDPSVPTYTDFEGPYIYWTSITAQLSGFLDRRAGLSLYCHSMSCTLSALAGNHGVFAEQLVLGVGFDTNLTRAAGTTEWRRWSFNSHSVVSPDGGDSIWDSSIALDGDDNPYAEPVDPIMPRGMSGEDYFWRLTYDDIEIVNQGLCFIE